MSSKTKQKKAKNIPQIELVSLPLECILYGSPATLQSESERKEYWIKNVADILREARGKGKSCLPHREFVRVRLRYYFLGQPWDCERDADNIVKPILDAAKGIIYQDDRQVIEVCSHKYSRTFDQSVTGNQLTLAALRGTESEFVHVAFRDGLITHRKPILRNNEEPSAMKIIASDTSRRCS
jgi:hypothetical protein